MKKKINVEKSNNIFTTTSKINILNSLYRYLKSRPWLLLILYANIRIQNYLTGLFC